MTNLASCRAMVGALVMSVPIGSDCPSCSRYNRSVMAKKRRNSTPGSSAPSEQSDSWNVGPWLAFAGTIIAAAITAYATLNNAPAQMNVVQNATEPASAPATPPAAQQPTSPPAQPAGSQGQRSATQAASARPSKPETARPKRSVAGRWTGTLTFGGGSADHDRLRQRLDLQPHVRQWPGRIGQVVFGSGKRDPRGRSSSQTRALLVRIHRDGVSDERECSSGGRSAGSIALTRAPTQPSPVASVPRSVSVA